MHGVFLRFTVVLLETHALTGGGSNRQAAFYATLAQWIDDCKIATYPTFDENSLTNSWSLAAENGLFTTSTTVPSSHCAVTFLLNMVNKHCSNALVFENNTFQVISAALSLRFFGKGYNPAVTVKNTLRDISIVCGNQITANVTNVAPAAHSCLTDEIFLQKFRLELETCIGENTSHTRSIEVLSEILKQLLDYEEHLRHGRTAVIAKNDLSLHNISLTLQANHAVLMEISKAAGNLDESQMNVNQDIMASFFGATTDSSSSQQGSGQGHGKPKQPRRKQKPTKPNNPRPHTPVTDAAKQAYANDPALRDTGSRTLADANPTYSDFSEGLTQDGQRRSQGRAQIHA
jgi:hypothetical protein